MIKENLRAADSNIFEGMISFRAVIEAIESGKSDRRIERVVYNKARTKKLAGHLSYIRAMSYKHNFEVNEADVSQIDAAAVGSQHGGVLTYCSERTYPKLTPDALQGSGFFVYLEGVEDPYNFGYAVRSIYAAGADGIILPEHNWLSAAGVVCRASAGAAELCDFYTADSESLIAAAHSQGYSLICADLKNSRPVYEVTMKRPLILAVGGEKRGLTKVLLDSADMIVRLEYGRDFPNALSAASAASILAFEVLRRTM